MSIVKEEKEVQLEVVTVITSTVLPDFGKNVTTTLAVPLLPTLRRSAPVFYWMNI